MANEQIQQGNLKPVNDSNNNEQVNTKDNKPQVKATINKRKTNKEKVSSKLF